MYWRAQYAKWPRRGRAFQHSAGIEPTSTDSVGLTATSLNHWAIDSYQRLEKNGIWLVVFRHLQPIFLAHRTVILGFFKLNIKARHDIQEFLNANLWSIYLITFYIDWSWNIFTLHNIFSMLIEQLIDLEKVRIDNLNLRTALWDQIMDSWSVTQ